MQNTEYIKIMTLPVGLLNVFGVKSRAGTEAPRGLWKGAGMLNDGE